jgi:sterol desaturase/sphingolipid hydroxylase (fatty acid hydroxylase superfamily)
VRDSSRSGSEGARGAAIRAAVIGGGLALFAALERRRPLRRRVESQVVRSGRNAAIGGVALVVSTLLQMALARRLSAWRERRVPGVVSLLGLPRPFDDVASFALLDYTLWIWHRANHRQPLLWRFHLVHHIDLDLDASTALRFHFGEMALSVLFRALQVALIGPTRRALSIWQDALFASILFHHSNLSLPRRCERLLALLLVTPRMHGIHHSACRDHAESNWSSLLSLWDHLHGTYRSEPSAETIVIGVPAWQEPQEVTLGRMLVQPFAAQRDDWQEPVDQPVY